MEGEEREKKDERRAFTSSKRKKRELGTCVFVSAENATLFSRVYNGWRSARGIRAIRRTSGTMIVTLRIYIYNSLSFSLSALLFPPTDELATSSHWQRRLEMGIKCARPKR